MRVVALYHPNSEHSGVMDSYATEFSHYKAKQIEMTSLDTQQGADMAQTYGITQYPAVLAVDDTGSVSRIWQGFPLPLMDELSSYAGQSQSTMLNSGGKTILPLTPSVA
jgi:thioredoxin-like negative regulator of GroEL